MNSVRLNQKLFRHLCPSDLWRRVHSDWCVVMAYPQRSVLVVEEEEVVEEVQEGTSSRGTAAGSPQLLCLCCAESKPSGAPPGRERSRWCRLSKATHTACYRLSLPAGSAADSLNHRPTPDYIHKNTSHSVQLQGNAAWPGVLTFYSTCQIVLPGLTAHAHINIDIFLTLNNDNYCICISGRFRFGVGVGVDTEP